MKLATVDITPDKSLIKKLGLAGYKTEQAVAELIDNAIDARLEGRTCQIHVRLNFRDRSISVFDDGRGMSQKELGDGMIIAKDSGKARGSLGMYGMGMKSACSSLGSAFSLVTAREDSEAQCAIRYDEDEWIADKSQTWQNLKIESNSKTRPWHGTEIIITKLKIPLYSRQTTIFKERFGIRYGEYIRSGQISLYINTVECKAAGPEVEKDSKRSIDIAVPDGAKISGWIGLMKRRSVKGDYGIHLYKHGRLVRAFEKFGMRAHPELAKMVGELHLDHVPVNFYKTRFITESPEYADALERFESHPDVVRTRRNALRRPHDGSSLAGVIKYLEDDAQAGKIRPRISRQASRSILQNASDVSVKTESGTIELEFTDGVGQDFYEIELLSRSCVKVRMDRKSPVFAVGNPLFLIGLAGLEAKMVLEDPGRGSFLASRNKSWSRFVSRWTDVPTSYRKKPKRTAPAGKYRLANVLLDMHDYLAEKFPSEFQFTALCTLKPFLDNTYRRLAYNMEAGKGAGQFLYDTLLDHFSESFTVLLNPNAAQVDMAYELTDNNDIILIREVSRMPAYTVARPEKAWVDLLVEIGKKRVRIPDYELENILERLSNDGSLDINRLHSTIRRRKKMQAAEPYLVGISA